MEIKRTLAPIIESRMFENKAILLIGARQVGKTTLFRYLTRKFNDCVVMLNCDDSETRRLLADPTYQGLRLLAGNNRYMVIDEAQRVENIGITLKRIVEQLPELQLLVTGSSSFDLKKQLNEPLTGRKFEYNLYPISSGELLETYGLIKTRDMLEFRLIYGSYPEIITHPEDARARLLEICESYLYKDILADESIRRPVLLNKILIALALQVGSEVKYNEVAQTVGSDPKTVEKYIDLLEKSFIVFRLPALSRNISNELKKGKKIYFYDCGVRNAILNNFAPGDRRTDMGALWENFFICERLKYNHYRGYRANSYFWRTTTQQEVDLIEERDGEMTIFEMKWNPASKCKIPQALLDNYPVSATHIITPANYLEFLTD